MKKFLLILSVISSLLLISSCNNQEPEPIDWASPQAYDTLPVVSGNQTVKAAGHAAATTYTQTTSTTDLYLKYLLILLLLIVAVGAGFFFFRKVLPLGVWIRAKVAGVKNIPVHSLVTLSWKRVPVVEILELMIKASTAGVELDINKLGDAYLAEVDLEKVVDALIEAHNANIKEVTFDKLVQHYLANVDLDQVMEALLIAESADIETSLDELAKLNLAGADTTRIIKTKMAAKNSGYNVEINDLVQHYLAGGNIEKTVEAYIAANKADLKDFDFKDVADIDLAGYDVIEMVNKAIIPRIVETDGVRGIARDGVELIMKVKVTLRAKLKEIIGAPEEKTVLARVNESLATEIGLARSHYDVLQSPYELADKVEQKNLDKDSAFEILSIDVSDIKVGKDVDSELKTERAKAEAERAKAELIKAEEKVKKAMAAAFLDGKITVEDYEKLQNLQADTEMRKNIGQNTVITNEDEDEINIDGYTDTQDTDDDQPED